MSIEMEGDKFEMMTDGKEQVTESTELVKQGMETVSCQTVMVGGVLEEGVFPDLLKLPQVLLRLLLMRQ